MGLFQRKKPRGALPEPLETFAQRAFAMYMESPGAFDNARWRAFGAQIERGDRPTVAKRVKAMIEAIGHPMPFSILEDLWEFEFSEDDRGPGYQEVHIEI